MRRACALVLLVGTLSALHAPPVRADERTRVLVVPLGRGVSADASVRAGRAAGFDAIALADADPSFVRAADAAETDERTRLAAVQAGLEEAERAWLAQRFGDMLARLQKIESDQLVLLARPEHVAMLWELEFQLGLAHLSRQGDGDAAAARRRFLLALELDGARRPAREVYGPAVVEAFALAATEQARHAARPLGVRVDPADAELVVDGVPVIERGRSRLLRAGPHVLLASAPGFVTEARVVDLDDAPLALALVRVEGQGAAAALAPVWSRGALAPDAPTTRAWLLALGKAAGARAIVLVDEGAAGVRTRAVTADAATDWLAGAAAAFARLDASGGVVVAAVPGGDAPAAERSVWKSPWLWTGVGVAVVGAVVLGVVLLSDDPPADRLHVVFE